MVAIRNAKIFFQNHGISLTSSLLPKNSSITRNRHRLHRKTLPHGVPNWIDTTQETFFITINCLPRGTNQLAIDGIWDALLESITFREDSGDWKWRLILAMPDHLHGIVGFPDGYFMKKSISTWKRWMARSQPIIWQRDFFDHRLRGVESAVEKANYIRMNPVRAGLVANPDEWPCVR